MNMKLAITKKTSSRIFNRAPINFWEPEKVEEDSTTKNNFYQDSICHEVKYDRTDKKSDTYKKYIKPFSYGTPEQWLKFMEYLNVIIRGNGLDKNGPARFNLTRSSLKGEALRVFNDKAAEQEQETKTLIPVFNVSVLLRNKCSPKTICFPSRKLICATTCSFT
jgi:hypothetical protein